MNRPGRGFAHCAFVVVLGGVLHLTAIDRAQSQTVGEPIQAPAPALRPDQAKAILSVLADAESHGFRPNQFGQDELQRLLASRDPVERRRGEAQLWRSIVAYARAQRGGRVPRAAFSDDWGVRPAAYEPEPDLAFALANDRLGPWLASLAPPFERYRALRTALGRYRAIEARGGWEPIAEGPVLKPGAKGARVTALRRRIAAETPEAAGDLASPVYDSALAAAVAAAQARYGLSSDGVVGPATLAAFNKPVSARIAQIAANMERWRWMPRIWPRTRVEVNIASATLDVYADESRVDTMRVAVGTRGNKTPMLRSEIHSVVLNPPWNVPTSIASKELLPKGEAYLARNGYRFVSNGAGGLRLQQRPGPGNSLGRIKFDFQNPYGVYLHDTNARAVFELDSRLVSHGCVRVERPEDLARILLEHRPDWDVSRLDHALQDTATVREKVEQSWPIMMLYWTVFVDPDGQINFRDDIYGWDDELATLIDGGHISA